MLPCFENALAKRKVTHHGKGHLFLCPQRRLKAQIIDCSPSRIFSRIFAIFSQVWREETAVPFKETLSKPERGVRNDPGKPGGLS